VIVEEKKEEPIVEENEMEKIIVIEDQKHEHEEPDYEQEQEISNANKIYVCDLNFILI